LDSKSIVSLFSKDLSRLVVICPISVATVTLFSLQIKLKPQGSIASWGIEKGKISISPILNS